MRGKKLFDEVFRIEMPEARYRGRNLDLIKRRNTCLADRYYYYGHFTDKRFEAILDHLQAEFFLSTRTIRDIIDAQLPYLHELKQAKPGRSTLERKWPHLCW
jgi:hypothetical protein